MIDPEVPVWVQALRDDIRDVKKELASIKSALDAAAAERGSIQKISIKAEVDQRTLYQRRYRRRALAALDKSIRHWERMVEGTHGPDETPGNESCACCNEFYYSGEGCGDCPVALYVGKGDCKETPWHVARDAFYSRAYNRHNGMPDERRHAQLMQTEVDFLRRVRAAVESGEVTSRHAPDRHAPDFSLDMTAGDAPGMVTNGA